MLKTTAALYRDYMLAWSAFLRARSAAIRRGWLRGGGGFELGSCVLRRDRRETHHRRIADGRRDSLRHNDGATTQIQERPDG